jgi:hypothetical protein
MVRDYIKFVIKDDDDDDDFVLLSHEKLARFIALDTMKELARRRRLDIQDLADKAMAEEVVSVASDGLDCTHLWQEQPLTTRRKKESKRRSTLTALDPQHQKKAKEH